jgi:hypothetical protein
VYFWLKVQALRRYIDMIPETVSLRFTFAGPLADVHIFKTWGLKWVVRVEGEAEASYVGSRREALKRANELALEQRGSKPDLAGGWFVNCQP